jgi:hypothetical protein
VSWLLESSFLLLNGHAIPVGICMDYNFNKEVFEKPFTKWAEFSSKPEIAHA